MQKHGAGGGGSGSRATAWCRPMHGPSSGCGREWRGWTVVLFTCLRRHSSQTQASLVQARTDVHIIGILDIGHGESLIYKGSSLPIDNRQSNAQNRHFYHAALLALRKTRLYDSMLPGDWLSDGSPMTSRGSCIRLRPARRGFARQFKIRKFFCQYRVLGTGYNDENCSILHEEFITGKCRWSFHMPFKYSISTFNKLCIPRAHPKSLRVCGSKILNSLSPEARRAKTIEKFRTEYLKCCKP